MLPFSVEKPCGVPPCKPAGVASEYRNNVPSTLIRSAIDGHGVALVRHVVACQEVATGELVRLLDISVASPDGYYLVCTEAGKTKPPVQAFRRWLLAEVAQFLAVPTSNGARNN